MNYFVPIIFFIIAAILVIAASQIKSEKNPYLKKMDFSNGSMTKLEYENHSYIAWTCNLGCSMVHNPECECINNN